MAIAQARRQLLRYALVGVISNLLLYVAYIALTTIGMEHKIAMSLVYCCGVVATFFANRNWSFSHDGVLHSAFFRYIATYLFGYLLNLGLLWFAVDRFMFPHQFVQAAAIIIVAISLFLLHKYWVFPSTKIDTP